MAERDSAAERGNSTAGDRAGVEDTATGVSVGAASPLLDEAFERMAGSDFELPNGFVNHGPMACEALAVLGRDDLVEGWARRSTEMTGDGPEPVPPGGSGAFDWQEALGDYDRLPEWLGYFAATVGDEGWREVVAGWVPRLVPALSTALFHGAIRTAHAVRAVEATDTQPRRSELARALAYWAARYHPGSSPSAPETPSDVVRAVTGEAATGAHHYLAAPNIFNLHGVTGAMAVELLAPHLRPEDAAAALVQVSADHAAMYAGTGTAGADATARLDTEVIELAATSGDPHQVKLVEACRRGLAVDGDHVFATAAGVVVGRG